MAVMYGHEERTASFSGSARMWLVGISLNSQSPRPMLKTMGAWMPKKGEPDPEWCRRERHKGGTQSLTGQDWGMLAEDLLHGGLYWSLVWPDHPPAQFRCG